MLNSRIEPRPCTHWYCQYTKLILSWDIDWRTFLEFTYDVSVPSCTLSTYERSAHTNQVIRPIRLNCLLSCKIALQFLQKAVPPLQSSQSDISWQSFFLLLNHVNKKLRVQLMFTSQILWSYQFLHQKHFRVSLTNCTTVLAYVITSFLSWLTFHTWKLLLCRREQN